MANLQNVFYRDLFQQNSERLKYLITVFKPHKKKSKSSYFLAIVVNNLKNLHYLCLIKKNDQSLRKDSTWNFDEIQQIDGKFESEEPEFEIVFTNKQTFKWIANNKVERSTFLHSIKQIVSQMPTYSVIKLTNMSSDENSILANQLDEISANDKMDDGEWNQEEESYQALTSREEADLERLLELEVENTINNAEAFTEKLSRDLASMDSSNIQDIMASEQRVSDLMQIIQNSIDETFRLENKITQYEGLLKNVRDIVQKVERKEAIVQIYNDNNKRLRDELGEIVTKLDFNSEYEYALTNFKLNSLSDLPKCLKAALKLQEAIQFETTPTLNSLKGVTDQKLYLNNISRNFSNNLVDQLNKMIINLSNDYQNKFISSKGSDWVINEHTSAHKQLSQYTPLMKWLRAMDPKAYSSIVSSYTNAFRSIYDKEFSYFFDYLRQQNATHLTKSFTLSQASSSPSETKRKSLAINTNDTRSDVRRSSYTPSIHTDTFETSSTRSSEISNSEWDDFDSYIEFLLKTVDPVCLSEQHFCNVFFDLESQVNISEPSTPVFNKHDTETDTSISNHSSNFSDQSSQSKKNEQLRNILADLFKSLENEFINFVHYYDKLDGIYSIYFLVRLSNSVLSAQDTGSFLSKTYGNIVINVKRNFDRYMQEQQIKIEDAKDPKGTKVGVLSFVKRFEAFAKQTENIIKFGPERRSDVDRWYVMLMEKIFQSISRIAKEHQKNYKTPSQMIELENYHYLQNMLASLKISSLEMHKKEAKSRYNNALKEYVSLYFSRPLEKLNIFFEGVQQKVQQGIREEEIGYQLAFNKQELRKVIKECNLKDIKRGLEEMYKRVEKHVYDSESTLIEVIWHSMQEEFIIQYKNIQTMIERCYPHANITLLFTIDNVLRIFSDIAQTH